MIIYLLIYLFHFASLVQAQTMWALAISNGFFFFSLFHSGGIYIYLQEWLKKIQILSLEQ
jgi:hypothetical protein